MCDQKGSFVDDEKLRFDFSWSGALSPEQVRTFHEDGKALWLRMMDVAHPCPTCKQRGRCRFQWLIVFHVDTDTIRGLVDSQEKGNVAASHDQGYWLPTQYHEQHRLCQASDKGRLLIRWTLASVGRVLRLTSPSQSRSLDPGSRIFCWLFTLSRMPYRYDFAGVALF